VESADGTGTVPLASSGGNGAGLGLICRSRALTMMIAAIPCA